MLDDDSDVVFEERRSEEQQLEYEGKEGPFAGGIESKRRDANTHTSSSSSSFSSDRSFGIE